MAEDELRAGGVILGSGCRRVEAVSEGDGGRNLELIVMLFLKPYREGLYSPEPNATTMALRRIKAVSSSREVAALRRLCFSSLFGVH